MSVVEAFGRKVDEALEVADGELDVDVLEALSQEARALAPDLTLCQKSALMDQLARLIQRVTGAKDAVQEELGEVGGKRRAMKGYGRQRGRSRQGQRVWKQV